MTKKVSEVTLVQTSSAISNIITYTRNDIASLKAAGAVKFKVMGVVTELIKNYYVIRENEPLKWENIPLKLEFLGIIGVNINGQTMMSSNDLVALPCPPYCTDVHDITIYEILAMN